MYRHAKAHGVVGEQYRKVVDFRLKVTMGRGRLVFVVIFNVGGCDQSFPTVVVTSRCRQWLLQLAITTTAATNRYVLWTTPQEIPTNI